MVRTHHQLLFASVVSVYWNAHLAEMLLDETFGDNEMLRRMFEIGSGSLVSIAFFKYKREIDTI